MYYLVSKLRAINHTMYVPVRAAASAFSASSKGVAESALSFFFPLTRRAGWALALIIFGGMAGGFEVYNPFQMSIKIALNLEPHNNKSIHRAQNSPSHSLPRDKAASTSNSECSMASSSAEWMNEHKNSKFPKLDWASLDWAAFKIITVGRIGTNCPYPSNTQ